MSVWDNLLMGGYLLRDQMLLKERLDQAVEAVPICQTRARDQAGPPSGGEQKPVALAAPPVRLPESRAAADAACQEWGAERAGEGEVAADSGGAVAAAAARADHGIGAGRAVEEEVARGADHDIAAAVAVIADLVEAVGGRQRDVVAGELRAGYQAREELWAARRANPAASSTFVNR